MSFWVYILECSDKSYYSGHTDDLEKRIWEHGKGTVKCYTSNRHPIKLVFCDEFPTRDDAFERERQIKGWSRRKKQALIEENWEDLILFSKTTKLYLSTSSG